VVRVEAEAGSAVNGSRAKVRRLLPDPAVTVVVAGHRDRLGRVNTELVEAALSAHNRRLVVPGDSEPAGDLAGDMAEVLTSLCASALRAPAGAEPGVEGSGLCPAGHRARGSEVPGLRRCRVSALREIAGPFVVAPPAGVRVRARLRVSGTDAGVLREVGEYLGSLASGDLAARCAEGRLDAGQRARSRQVRKQELTAKSSSRWAGALTRTSEDAYQLAYRNLLAERRSLLARIQRIETRLVVTAGQRAGRVRVCRGGKNLLRKRNSLAAAGLTETQRRERWEASRLFLTADGEKDKTWGNETIRWNPDQNWLEIRLPTPLARLANRPSGRYRLSCPVGFTYRGGDAAAQAATGAVRYDISFDPARGRWYLDASWKTPPAAPVTLARARQGSVVAVDVNAGHLAVAVLAPMATRPVSRAPSACHWRACRRAPGTGGCGLRSPASSPSPASTGPAPW
jgi:hypothetical protein